MAFVNELIPEEEKERFSFPVSERRDGSKPTLWKWTVDRDRDAFLVFTNAEGGGYEGTQLTKHFVLSWKGKLVTLCADPLPALRNDAGVIKPWRIHKLRIPLVLHSQREEVIQLIREAFSTMGDVYDGEQYASVIVEINGAESA